MKYPHTHPLISVYIATHNRANLLANAINSVFAQTYKNLELIVVDDGSTDHTIDILESFKIKHDNFHYLTFEQPKGAPSARNLAIEHAKGEFITGLDDDDQFTPTRIELFIKNYSDQWSFLCSGLAKYDGINYKALKSTKQTISWEGIKRNNLVGNQIFIERKRLLLVGGFDKHFLAWQDYDLWLRLIKEFGPALKLSQHTYIQNVQSEINRISSSSKTQRGYEQFIAKHRESLSNIDLANQKINHYSNNNIPPKISDYFELLPPSTIMRLNKLFIKTHLPNLFRFYERILQSAKNTKLYHKVKSHDSNPK